MSSTFAVELVVLCIDASLDFDAIVGQPASFTIAARRWQGFCREAEQIAAAADGTSTYRLCIVPALWFLSQRRNYRVYQNQSALDIALAILRGDWQIEPVVRADLQACRPREYRVQHAESDLEFIARILEDAGICYFFEQDGNDNTLVLCDAPHDSTPARSILYLASPTRWDEELATSVTIRQQTRARRVAVCDHDPRRHPTNRLLAAAHEPCASSLEARLEQYRYAPGAFLFAGAKDPGTPLADDKGCFRSDEVEAARTVHRMLAAERTSAKCVRFETNALDLAPGALVHIADHPCAELNGLPLLVVEATLTGTHDGEWRSACVAHAANVPYCPPHVTPRPRVSGLESATVVGPPGEEIHVDELGRVRVQFHWDRYANMNDDSSCWLVVSQPWAGAGYGAIHIPRIGQEVLVDFLGGDPDEPVIVGRVHTALQLPPYALPEHKTRSGWRSSTSPGGGGFNEVMLDDGAGAELINVQAERDLTKLVKNDESVVIGNNRDALTRNNEALTVGQSQTIRVGVDRSARIGVEDTLRVGKRHRVSIEPVTRDRPTSLTISDERITLDTGTGATITLEGDEIILRADKIRFIGEREVTGKVERGDLTLLGGPMVKVNC